MKELLAFNQKSTEWCIVANKEFSITVKHWIRKGFQGGYSDGGIKDINHWNVYLCIFEDSEFFTKPTAIESAPWHGGVTYDQVFTQAPAQGIKYDWQKEGGIISLALIIPMIWMRGSKSILLKMVFLQRLCMM